MREIFLESIKNILNANNCYTFEKGNYPVAKKTPHSGPYYIKSVFKNINEFYGITIQGNEIICIENCSLEILATVNQRLKLVNYQNSKNEKPA